MYGKSRPVCVLGDMEAANTGLSCLPRSSVVRFHVWQNPTENVTCLQGIHGRGRGPLPPSEFSGVALSLEEGGVCFWEGGGGGGGGSRASRMNRAARLCKGGSEQAASGGASAAWGCSIVQESRLLWGAPAARGCSIVQESRLL